MQVPRVCLVVPPFKAGPEGLLPPLGLLSIAATLQARAVPTVVVDLALSYNLRQLPPLELAEACACEILKSTPQIVGLTTLSVSLPVALTIADSLKKRDPGLLVVLGGPGIHGCAHLVLERFACVDCIVTGEGESAMLEIVNQYPIGKATLAPAGTMIRSGVQVMNGGTRLPEDLSVLPSPAFDLVPPPGAYARCSPHPVRRINIELARGCPFNCSFCSSSAFWNRRRRTFPVEKVLALAKDLRKRYQCEHFYVTDDNFTVSHSFARRFVQGMKAAEVGTWDARCRMDLVTPLLLREMAEAGCKYILYGVESHNETELNCFNKKISRVQQQNAILWTLQAGITPVLSYILGGPDQTESTCDSTMLETNMLTLLHPEVVCHFHNLSVLPGTELFNRLKDRLSNRASTSFTSLALTDYFEGVDTLIDHNPDIFSSFFEAPGLVEPKLLIRVSRWLPALLESCPYTLRLLRLQYPSYLSIFRLINREVFQSREWENSISEALACFISRHFRSNRLLIEMHRFEQILNAALSSPIGWRREATFSHDLAAIRQQLRTGSDVVATSTDRHQVVVEHTPEGLKVTRRLSPR